MGDHLGHNAALEAVQLHSKQEAIGHAEIDRLHEEADRLTTRMENIEHFLALIDNRTADSKRLDLTNAEDQALVDRLRDEGLEHIFPHQKYVWKDGEVENLQRMLRQHVEGSLQREIGYKTEQIVIKQQQLVELQSIFTAVGKREADAISHIQRNTVR